VFFEFAWNTCLEISERPPFSKDAGRNDCRPTEPGFVNYCDAGEWIASGYLHKTSFARHPWRSGTFTNHHGLLKENATGLLMTFSPRSGDPDVLHSRAGVSSETRDAESSGLMGWVWVVTQPTLDAVFHGSWMQS
jgi:hypothetical protein